MGSKRGAGVHVATEAGLQIASWRRRHRRQCVGVVSQRRKSAPKWHKATSHVHALVQHFDVHDLSNRSVPADVLGRAYEYLIKKFADDAGAKAGEFFTPPEVVDTLVRILEPRPGDTIYDPTVGSSGMLVHAANYLRKHGHLATHARYFGQEMNWGYSTMRARRISTATSTSGAAG